MLLSLIAVAVPVLAWLLVIRPLDLALAAARERHGEAVIALAETRAAVEALAAIDGAARTDLAAPLDITIAQAAAEAGFPVTSVTPEGPARAKLISPSVRPQAFFGWIGQMEARGLIAERLSARASPDQTLAVEVTFRARGR